MDPRMLQYYNRELQFIREMGGEFAKEYPKIAGRLGMDGLDCDDPYVERLLEGFSFLAARIQLKLDESFPAFTQHLPDSLAKRPGPASPLLLARNVFPMRRDAPMRELLAVNVSNST